MSDGKMQLENSQETVKLIKRGEIAFTEIKGMEELNNCKATVRGPYTFSIGDVSGLGAYKGGGLYSKVKMPKFLDFQPLGEQLKKPELMVSDFANLERAQQLHIGIQALHKFSENHDTQLPRSHHECDAQEVLELAKALAEGSEEKVELDEKLIKEFSYQACGDINPMAAFFGSLAAQEVLKAVSGKFHPITEWLYFNSLESLPESVIRLEEACTPVGSRYDGQIAVFGKEFQENISNMNQFLVGAGGIGCEMLKNWATIGLGTGPKGKIRVTDMDQIEKSNLNRQFLFRSKDAGKLKSDCASAAVQAMNPQLSGKIVTLRDRVGSDEEFWEELDGVTSALDNADAGTYVDHRCVFFRKPLLESGTLGTKGNSQATRAPRTRRKSPSPCAYNTHDCLVQRSLPDILRWTSRVRQSVFVPAKLYRTDTQTSGQRETDSRESPRLPCNR
jgi:ubiquitin-activating enzyme E1